MEIRKMRGENNKFFDDLIEEIKVIINSDKKRDKKLREICKLLKERVSYYNWVGFYLVNPTNERELILDTFIGEPTEHIKIPFGRGICGQAAEKKKTFIVQDVSKEENYLTCSVKVKAEIVVPIFKDDKLIGEIDIDSHYISSFTEEDKMFLERLSEIVASII
ncbi:MAG TPA: GAF domain-containing protein [Thermoplasmatales archaeon]|nr:GAF domain-containing protein [Thermoplasmatales archaeon]